MTETATPAPAVPPVASPNVTAVSVLPAVKLVSPVALTLAESETPSTALLLNTVTATAPSIVGSMIFERRFGCAVVLTVRSDVAEASSLPPAVKLVDAPWINTSGSAPPTRTATFRKAPAADAVSLPSTVEAISRSPAALSTVPPPISILALLKLVTMERGDAVTVPRLLLRMPLETGSGSSLVRPVTDPSALTARFE